jgi:hypothetical protein
MISDQNLITFNKEKNGEGSLTPCETKRQKFQKNNMDYFKSQNQIKSNIIVLDSIYDTKRTPKKLM